MFIKYILKYYMYHLTSISSQHNISNIACLINRNTFLPTFSFSELIDYIFLGILELLVKEAGLHCFLKLYERYIRESSNTHLQVSFNINCSYHLAVLPTYTPICVICVQTLSACLYYFESLQY